MRRVARLTPGPAVLAGLLGWIFTGGALRADQPVPRDSPPRTDAAIQEIDDAPPEALDRLGQVGMRLGLAGAMVAAIGFSNDTVCNEERDETCARFAGPLADVELSYGITDVVELTVSGRLGLLTDEAPQNRLFRFGMGIRLYESTSTSLRPFWGARLLADITENRNPENLGWATFDVGLRGEIGLQLDLDRAIGFYIEAGESITFVRALTFLTDLSIGAQFRIP